MTLMFYSVSGNANSMVQSVQSVRRLEIQFELSVWGQQVRREAIFEYSHFSWVGAASYK
jgi:hypothetical protein